MVAVVGLDDVVVVETQDALLVTNRARAQDVRLVVQALKDSGRTDLV
jgi:mannose-1-phosphate guanylyltransferase